MVATLLWRFLAPSASLYVFHWFQAYQSSSVRRGAKASRLGPGGVATLALTSQAQRCSSRWPMSSRRVSSAGWTSPVGRLGAGAGWPRCTFPRRAGSVHGFPPEPPAAAADFYSAVAGAGRLRRCCTQALRVTWNVIDLTHQFLILIALFRLLRNLSHESFEN